MLFISFSLAFATACLLIPIYVCRSSIFKSDADRIKLFEAYLKAFNLCMLLLAASFLNNPKILSILSSIR